MKIKPLRYYLTFNYLLGSILQGNQPWLLKLMVIPLMNFLKSLKYENSNNFNSSSKGGDSSMKLYEYQAKEIFQDYNIPVPGAEVAENPAEVQSVAEKLGSSVTLKAQVLVGGRGKAGGIKFADSPGEASQLAEELFALKIKGLPVEKLLVEEKLAIEKELYLGLTIDRSEKKPVLMVSSEGGVDIEEVAETSPDKIIKSHLSPEKKLELYQLREIISELPIPHRYLSKLAYIAGQLYRLFQEKDAQIAEINPLALTADGIMAADAKLVIDEDALFRQSEFSGPEEDLPYVELEGNVGCIVNGAGLAMSTMDTLLHCGGEPANFLDIGGGASAEVMAKALNKVSHHAGVESIFINILGGITRCDEVAKGILQTLDKVEVPVVVRLRGTNEKEGVKILQEEGLEVERSMTAATEKAISVAKE